jgi:hypothetical protein
MTLVTLRCGTGYNGFEFSASGIFASSNKCRLRSRGMPLVANPGCLDGVALAVYSK